MTIRRKSEKNCSRCGSEAWAGKKCAQCGKERSLSNWLSRVCGIEVTTGTNIKAEADAFDAHRRVLFAKEGVRALRLKKVPTLAEFSKDFLEHVEARLDLEPNTKRSYRNGWRILAGTSIKSLSLTQIDTPLASTLKLPGSGSNQNQALRTLSAILSFAVEKGWTGTAPRIPLRKENKRKAVIEPWQEDVLLPLASPKLRDFMTIMLDCGMRPEEIARMRWEHVLWADKAIHIAHGKSLAAERYVPMTERVAGLLRDRRNGSEWVFPCRITKAGKKMAKSGHIVPTSVGGKMWSQLLADFEAQRKRDSLPPLADGLVLYSCRHSFATRFLQAGGTTTMLKEIMGHSSLSVSERYVHPAIAEAAGIMDRFNADRRKLTVMGKRA